MVCAGIVLKIAMPCSCLEAESLRIDAEKEAERIQAEDELQKEREIEQQRISNIKRLFAKIPEGLRAKTFETFKVNAFNQAAYETARQYAATFPSPQGLMLFGPCGTGKTHLVLAIAIEQIKKNLSVIFGTVPALLDTIKATYDDDKGKEQKVVNALKNCSLLVLDDLGKEKPSEWVEEKLYEIINYRNTWNKPILVTLNIGLQSIKKRYPWNGEAIVSRLFEMCKGVKLDGPDHRIKR